MGTQLRVQQVAVRCGGGVYGSATRHASPAVAVGWRCRTRRGWRPIQKPPTPPTTISLPAPLFPLVFPRTQTPPFSLLRPLSLSHLICICFFLPPCPCPFWRAQRFDFSRGGAESEEEWWSEAGDLDLFLEGKEEEDGGAGAGAGEAAGEDEHHELAPLQLRALLQLRTQQPQGRRSGERRGDTAGAGDGRRVGVGLVGGGRGRAPQGGRQAGPACGGRGGAGSAAGGGEEARAHRRGQGAEPAEAAAAEPRLGAAGSRAEEGVPDGAGGEGQGPRAPQCRARAAGLHPPEREQHAPPDTEEHDGAREQEERRRRWCRRQGRGRQRRRRQEAPLRQELS